MTASVIIPPAIGLILGGLILPMLQVRLRWLAVLVLPLVTLVPGLAGTRRRVAPGIVSWIRASARQRRCTFPSVCNRVRIMAFAGGLFALNQNRVVELAAAFCYAGSAIGVVFAGRPSHGLHLLGNDGDCFHARGVERGPFGARGGTAICVDPSSRRRSPDGGRRWRNRHNRLGTASAKWRSTRCRAG